MINTKPMLTRRIMMNIINMLGMPMVRSISMSGIMSSRGGAAGEGCRTIARSSRTPARR